MLIVSSLLKAVSRCRPLAAGALIVLTASMGGALAGGQLGLTKTCTNAVGPGQPIPFEVQVYHPGPSGAVVTITLYDVQTGTYLTQNTPIEPYQTLTFNGSYTPTENPSTNTVILSWTLQGNPQLDQQATATCTFPEREEICRTPGFWKIRAGTEKDGENITQAVIDEVGSLSVCGKTITNTNLGAPGSAEEAMCIPIQGDIRLQLARELTAAALNCVMSGAGASCTGMSIDGLFADCNAECVANNDRGAMTDCIDMIDCWNNGGVWLPSDTCQLGTCGEEGRPCEKTSDCGVDEAGMPIECVPLPATCHTMPLVNEDLGLDFDPPGPASSSKKCNTAERNGCTIFGGCS